MKKFLIVFATFFLLSFQAHAMKEKTKYLSFLFTRLGRRSLRALLLQKNSWKLKSRHVGIHSLHTPRVVSSLGPQRRFYVIEDSKKEDVLGVDEARLNERIIEKFKEMTPQEKDDFLHGLESLRDHTLSHNDVVRIVTNLVLPLIIKRDRLSPEDQATLKQLIAAQADEALKEVNDIYDWSHDHIKKGTCFGKGLVYGVAGLTALNIVISFSVVVLAVVVAYYPELLGETKEQD